MRPVGENKKLCLQRPLRLRPKVQSQSWRVCSRSIHMGVSAGAHRPECWMVEPFWPSPWVADGTAGRRGTFGSVAPSLIRVTCLKNAEGGRRVPVDPAIRKPTIAELLASRHHSSGG